MEITRNCWQPSRKGSADYFTGSVRIDSPFKGSDPARVSGATVTFEAWCSHGLAHSSAWADTDCHLRRRVGAARGWRERGDLPR
jgi:hypothetical protein